jgi:hypothetical protein
MNTMPMRRIIKVLKISPAILYNRIDFLHAQAQAFAGERERLLVDRDDLGKRYLSVDRQKLIVNWSDRDNRKNTILLSMATADQTTGYLFAANVNFDSEMDSDETEKEMVRFGDHHRAKPFRRFARVWLPQDFEMAAERAKTRGTRKSRAAEAPKAGMLLASVEDTYDAALERDVEDGDGLSPNARLPVKGMLLHEQVVMSAHIQLVSRLLHRAPKLRFFIDQESGLRAAILASVPGRIVKRTADAFYVKVMKDFTVGEKLGKVGRSVQRLRKVMKVAGVDREGAELKLALEEIERLTIIGKWGDRWFSHPVADMREPEKLICWLTDIDAVSADPDEREEQLLHYARLYLKVSLTGVDRFFMQVRRALTIAERGIASASSEKRVWFGKSAYNPDVLVKLIELFRTNFNYIEIGEDGQTPAMRLGLAKGPIAPEDIIYFQPTPAGRKRSPQTFADQEESPSPQVAERASEENHQSA